MVNLRNSKRKIIGQNVFRDPVRASVRQPKKSVVYMAEDVRTPASSCLLRARVVTGVPLRHKHEKSDGTERLGRPS